MQSIIVEKNVNIKVYQDESSESESLVATAASINTLIYSSTVYIYTYLSGSATCATYNTYKFIN